MSYCAGHFACSVENGLEEGQGETVSSAVRGFHSHHAKDDGSLAKPDNDEYEVKVFQNCLVD